MSHTDLCAALPFRSRPYPSRARLPSPDRPAMLPDGNVDPAGPLPLGIVGSGPLDGGNHNRQKLLARIDPKNTFSAWPFDLRFGYARQNRSNRSCRFLAHGSWEGFTFLSLFLFCPLLPPPVTREAHRVGRPAASAVETATIAVLESPFFDSLPASLHRGTAVPQGMEASFHVCG